MELEVVETEIETNEDTTVQPKYSEDKFVNAALTAIHGEYKAPEVADTVVTEDVVVEDATATKEDQVFDIDKFVSEKTGGKFVKFDDLVAAPKEVAVDLKFENDESKAVYELLAAGKMADVLSFLADQSRDYKQMPDVDVLRVSEKKEHPYLSDEDINDLLADKYGIGEEITEDDRTDLTPAQLKEKEARIARGTRALKRDAAEHRIKLDSGKVDLKLPELGKKDAAPAVNKEQDDANNAVKEWMNQLETSVKDGPASIDHKFSVEIVENNNKVSYSIPFKIEGEQKKALDNYVKNFIPVLGTEADYVKDGKVDVDRIKQEGIDRLFGKQMFGSLLKEAVSRAKQSVIGGIKKLTETSNTIMPAGQMTHEEWLVKKAMHT